MHISNGTPSRSCELIQADLDCKRGTAIGAGFLALMTSLAGTGTSDFESIGYRR